ncbi:PEP-CTERM sorting domain-containing protein [Methylovulum sp.]|nr:PEP-CTERM sorting domain-containing protein [Methylovulum sp.]MDD5124922.1 PEP-CTERM sorting domain-containing protein [Methylovulum sp.]
MPKIICPTSKPKNTFRKLLISGVSAFSFLLSGVALSGQVNLIHNGSFESTTVSNSAKVNNSNLSGWNIGTGTGGGYTFLTFSGQAGVNVGGGFPLWNVNNVIPNSSPDQGKFIVSDGAYHLTTLYQTVTGLTVGKYYDLAFYQAAGQQKGFDGSTTEQWLVSFGGALTTTNSILLPSGQTYTDTTQVVTGGQNQYSHLMSNPNHGFVPWEQQHMTFRATAQSELIGFLALGGPLGQPPFSLIDGISLTEQVPEPGSVLLMLVGGVAFAFLRRRNLTKTVANV